MINSNEFESVRETNFQGKTSFLDSGDIQIYWSPYYKNVHTQNVKILTARMQSCGDLNFLLQSIWSQAKSESP